MRKRRRIKKWPLITLVLLICLVFGALHFFKDYFKKVKEDNTPEIIEKEVDREKEYNVSFTLGGNVLINSNMWKDTKKEETYDFTSIFEYLNDIMKKSDINYYTQQSIVGGKDLGVSVSYNYNTPETLIDTLSNIGFNMASLASVHSYDKKETGITNAIKTMGNKGFTFSGIKDTKDGVTNNIVTKNGLKIGILSYAKKTDEVIPTDNSYMVSIYSDELAKKKVEELKKKTDIILVAIDFSDVNANTVSEEQKRIANYLSDLGVNIVVGNTGYSIQPIEIINNTLVCYSLGNLLSGHTSIDSRISAMVDFNLKITKKTEETKYTFGDVNVLLTYAYNNGAGQKYKVVPFTKITNELNNYKTYYEKYDKLLSKENITLYAIGD